MLTMPTARSQPRATAVAFLLGIPGGAYIGHAVAAALLTTGRSVLVPLVAALLLTSADPAPDGPLAAIGSATISVAGAAALVVFALALLG